MSVLNNANVREEIVHFLRNSDILSIAQRGVTTVTETFSGTGSSQVLTLTNNLVRNIRSLNDGTAKREYFDYTASYGSTTTITGTFASGSSNISVTYDYSTGTVENIWPDLPELAVITVNDFPRVGMDFISKKTEVMGIGQASWMSHALVDVRFYAKKSSDIDSYITTFRQAVLTNQRNFYHFKFSYVGNEGPLFKHDELASKIRERSVEFFLRFGFEA